LFIRGGKSEAYAVPESGLLHITFLIPLAFLLALIAREKWMKEHAKELFLLLFFLALSPVPSALTVIDSPNIQRSILEGLFFANLVGLGMWSGLEVFKKNRFIVGIVGVVMIAEMAVFLHNYTVHTDSFTSLYRNDGERELIAYLASQSNAPKIYLPTYGTMSMYYLFYNADFSPDYAGKFKNDVKINSVKNVEFVDTECPSEKVKLLPGEIVVDPIIACNNNWESAYTLKAKVVGKNQLVGFRVLEKKRMP
jgi:hypothetical protein